MAKAKKQKQTKKPQKTAEKRTSHTLVSAAGLPLIAYPANAARHIVGGTADFVTRTLGSISDEIGRWLNGGYKKNIAYQTLKIIFTELFRGSKVIKTDPKTGQKYVSKVWVQKGHKGFGKNRQPVYKQIPERNPSLVGSIFSGILGRSSTDKKTYDKYGNRVRPKANGTQKEQDLENYSSNGKPKTGTSLLLRLPLLPFYLVSGTLNTIGNGFKTIFRFGKKQKTQESDSNEQQNDKKKDKKGKDKSNEKSNNKTSKRSKKQSQSSSAKAESNSQQRESQIPNLQKDDREESRPFLDRQQSTNLSDNGMNLGGG